MRIVDMLVAVNQAVYGHVAYTTRLEVGVQTPGHTLSAALGSCRDSGWLLVAILRRLGLAARFVSGYLVQLTADVVPLDGPAGPMEDFTDLHAWAEVYVPGAGWVGLDPTSGLFAGEGHIPLSCTPEPSSATPITGATGIVETVFSFSNTVTRIHEDARVTKPYTDDAWEAVRGLGRHVDTLLEASDVRLTMGGEPTFVTSGDTSTPEWESEADGAEKRALAGRLATLLRQRWAPQGVVHHGQVVPGRTAPALAAPAHVARGQLSFRESRSLPERRTRELARVLDVKGAPRTALAVQERQGHVYVFLPPVDLLDDAVRLLIAVEDAAAATGQPVVLEGYPLPSDDRARSLSITPDPGVLEVNVQPTGSWDELEGLTTTLYEDARAAGLSTEPTRHDAAPRRRP